MEILISLSPPCEGTVGDVRAWFKERLAEVEAIDAKLSIETAYMRGELDEPDEPDSDSLTRCELHIETVEE